ncbi:hypothetical protein ACFZCL_32865 [Streptomyces sp. NPDC008159]|uniref:hypothetical protein n=1 Tax=Streptomyces sp. NPDC008159 TaxID=3364817 RepID=UPI0036E1817B
MVITASSFLESLGLTLTPDAVERASTAAWDRRRYDPVGLVGQGLDQVPGGAPLVDGEVDGTVGHTGQGRHRACGGPVDVRLALGEQDGEAQRA